MAVFSDSGVGIKNLNNLRDQSLHLEARMAGDGGTRRFVKLWWVLAFMAGVSAGALSVTFLGMTDTAWGLAGFGLPAAGVIAALEWFGQMGPRSGAARGYWRRPPLGNSRQMRNPSKARP